MGYLQEVYTNIPEDLNVVQEPASERILVQLYDFVSAMKHRVLFKIREISVGFGLHWIESVVKPSPIILMDEPMWMQNVLGKKSEKLSFTVYILHGLLVKLFCGLS